MTQKHLLSMVTLKKTYTSIWGGGDANLLVHILAANRICRNKHIVIDIKKWENASFLRYYS